MRISFEKISLNTLTSALFCEKNITCHVARFDRMHPIISGNKLFKLRPYLSQFENEDKNGIITLGGAYSNHLAAVAYYCYEQKIPCIGLVRGEKPDILSHTLIRCEQQGMQLIFVSREVYPSLSISASKSMNFAGVKNYLFIPEGGFGSLGALGAQEMYHHVKDIHPTHIILPVGTATTLTGFLSAAEPHIQIIGVPVLKGMLDIKDRINHMTDRSHLHRLSIWDEFHFGGYAKYSSELLTFMNDLHAQNVIPTDFVYTGKMMYAVMRKIEENYFEPHSRLVCIHTGGLQGNISLPSGSLNFIC